MSNPTQKRTLADGCCRDRIAGSLAVQHLLPQLNSSTCHVLTGEDNSVGKNERGVLSAHSASDKLTRSVISGKKTHGSKTSSRRYRKPLNKVLLLWLPISAPRSTRPHSRRVSVPTPISKSITMDMMHRLRLKSPVERLVLIPRDYHHHHEP